MLPTYRPTKFRDNRCCVYLQALTLCYAVFALLCICDRHIPELRRRLVADKCSPGKVCNMTSGNFDDTIKGQTTLVKFFAPWCGHCKQLAPEYKKAASKLGNAGVQLMEFDATQKDGASIAKQFGVDGYPFMALFKDGKFVKEVNPGRKGDKIANFVAKQNGITAGALAAAGGIMSYFSSDNMQWVGKYIVLPIAGIGIFYWGYRWWTGRSKQPEEEKPLEPPEKSPPPEPIEEAPDVKPLKSADPYVEPSPFTGMPFKMFCFSGLLLVIVCLIWCNTQIPHSKEADDQAVDQYDIENPAPLNRTKLQEVVVEKQTTPEKSPEPEPVSAVTSKKPRRATNKLPPALMMSRSFHHYKDEEEHRKEEEDEWLRKTFHTLDDDISPELRASAETITGDEPEEQTTQPQGKKIKSAAEGDPSEGVSIAL